MLVDELTGNTLAYALSALQTAMSYDFAWQFNNSFVEKILLLTGNPNPNVVKSSLRILCRMCESPKYLKQNLIKYKISFLSIIVFDGKKDMGLQQSVQHAN